MNRGDRREPIFKGDKDRVLFLDTLAEACEKTDCMGAATHVASLLQRHMQHTQNSEKTLF
jgi:hypothetical protein